MNDLPHDLQCQTMGRFPVLVAAIVAGLTTVGAGQGQQAFRAATDLVPLYVTVTDARGLLVTDLTKDRFTVRDNGRPQTIEFFEAGVQPITIAILLDRSPSLYDENSRMQAALAEFTRRFVPGDRACLGFFSHVVSLDPTLTDDAEALLRHLGDPAPLPAGTALWDALEAGRQALAGQGGRRVILVVTDAADNASRADIETVRADLERDGLLLYVLAVRGRGGLQTVNLEALSRTTGGWYFELKPGDNLAETMQRVADELHRQYVVAFRPERFDDKVHRLEVRVQLPLGQRRDLTVRARRSYMASKPVGLR